VILVGNAEEEEQVGILGARETRERADEEGGLLLLDHLLVQARGVAAGQDVLNGVVDRRIGVPDVGLVVAQHHHRLGRIVHGDPLLRHLFRFLGDRPAAHLALRDGAEVLFGQRLDLGGVDVAHHRDGDVPAHVILLVERHGFGGAGGGKVRHVPHGGFLVRVGLERRGLDLLDEPPDGVALGALPALLHDDQFFLVKLARDGAEQALGFQPGP